MEDNSNQILMVLLRLDEALNKLNTRLGEIEKKVEGLSKSSNNSYPTDPRGEGSERKANRFSGQARGRDSERRDYDSGRQSRLGGSDRRGNRYSNEDREKGSPENNERKPSESRYNGDKGKSTFSHGRKDGKGYKGKGGSGDNYKPRRSGEAGNKERNSTSRPKKR